MRDIAKHDIKKQGIHFPKKEKKRNSSIPRQPKILLEILVKKLTPKSLLDGLEHFIDL